MGSQGLQQPDTQKAENTCLKIGKAGISLLFKKPITSFYFR
jgi:hypothetical protein